MAKNRTTESSFNFLISGIVLLTIFFLTYNYFITSKPDAGSITKNERKGQVDTEAAVITRGQAVAGAESVRVEWVATDYKKGDLKNGKYVVKKGDTLWEIAEAVYGNGNQWHRILNANKDKVGFLPNGSQALIEVGQTLSLP